MSGAAAQLTRLARFGGRLFPSGDGQRNSPATREHDRVGVMRLADKLRGKTKIESMVVMQSKTIMLEQSERRLKRIKRTLGII